MGLNRPRQRLKRQVAATGPLNAWESALRSMVAVTAFPRSLADRCYATPINGEKAGRCASTTKSRIRQVAPTTFLYFKMPQTKPVIVLPGSLISAGNSQAQLTDQ